MNEAKKEQIANDAIREVEKVLQKNGTSVVNLTKRELMIMVDCFIAGAKVALLVVMEERKHE